MYDGALSSVYDRLIDFDYEGYLNAIAPYLKGRGADLGCGSGTMTALIRALGCEVSGIDSSIEMLNVAAGKSGCEDIQWIMGDMSLVGGFKELDFVTCVCEIGRAHV